MRAGRPTSSALACAGNPGDGIRASGRAGTLWRVCEVYPSLVRTLRHLLLVIGLSGGACGGEADPGLRAGGQGLEPRSETPLESSSRSTTSPADRPHNAAPSGGTPASVSAQPELRPGLGSCQQDGDCVAAHSINPSGYGEHACCIRFCPPAPAMSRALFEQESRWKEQSCGTVKCGGAPPAPCRSVDFDLVPRCVAGACASEVRKRPPRRTPEL